MLLAFIVILLMSVSGVFRSEVYKKVEQLDEEDAFISGGAIGFEIMKTVTELGLTLPILQRENGAISFSARELIAYHCLHFGSRPIAVKNAIDVTQPHLGDLIKTIENSELKRIAEHARALLPDILEEEKVNSAMPLGRIAVLDGTEVAGEMDDLAKRVTANSSNGPHQFLVPEADDVRFSYIGGLPGGAEGAATLNDEIRVRTANTKTSYEAQGIAGSMHNYGLSSLLPVEQTGIDN